MLVQGGSDKANTYTSNRGPILKQQKAIVAPLPAINAPLSKLPQQRHLQQLTTLSKYSAKLANIDTPYYRVGVNPKGPSSLANAKDKADRATTEQVLDPRTRVILYKMIGRGLLGEINGCVSTGKEANVYHAVAPMNPDMHPQKQEHLALKIYKTSTLQFTNRSHYIEGEHRFKRGYSSSRNPRKLIRLWAEKEMRNLKRLFAAGLPCPEPLELRENVLVMRFVGDADGWPAPRLKDASIPSETLPRLYLKLLITARKMYQQCRLVHADLSEYNILYVRPLEDKPEQEATLFVIDVSQSVEHDHPLAFDFLRKDLTNVERFFGSNGVRCIGLRKAFEYVIREGANCDEELESWMESPERDEAEENGTQDDDDDTRKLEEAVFAKSFIPRKLDQVYDPERDIDLMNKQSKTDSDGLIYRQTGVIGIVGQESAKVHFDEEDENQLVVRVERKMKRTRERGSPEVIDTKIEK